MFGLAMPKLLLGVVGVEGVVGVVAPLLVLRGKVLEPLIFLVLASEEVEEDADEQGEIKPFGFTGTEIPLALSLGSGVTGLLTPPLLDELSVGLVKDVAPNERLLPFFCNPGWSTTVFPSRSFLWCMDGLPSPLEVPFPLFSGWLSSSSDVKASRSSGSGSTNACSGRLNATFLLLKSSPFIPKLLRSFLCGRGVVGVLGTVDGVWTEVFLLLKFNGVTDRLGRLCLLRIIGEFGALLQDVVVVIARSAGPLILGILQLVGGEVKSKYKLPVLLGETVPGSSVLSSASRS